MDDLAVRNFIRHPASIPIEVRRAEHAQPDGDELRDVSHGGLCFHSERELAPGTRVEIAIGLVQPPFQAPAAVVWCRSEVEGYMAGAAFLGAQDAYRARMVEQICHIEHYRSTVLAQEGRKLTSHEAALEWIARYANEFPDTGC